MEKLVFRQYALPVSAFDHLKDYQRDHEARHRVHLTNSETLALILDEHKQTTVESEEHVNARSRTKERAAHNER